MEGQFGAAARTTTPTGWMTDVFALPLRSAPRQGKSISLAIGDRRVGRLRLPRTLARVAADLDWGVVGVHHGGDEDRHMRRELPR